MASIRARKLASGGATFQVQFRVAGRVTGEAFTTIEAAEAFGEMVDRVGGEAARQIRNSRDRAGTTSMTLNEWTEKYLTKANGMVGGVSERTLKDYGDIARRSFLKFLGEYPVSEIDGDHVGQWIAWQESQRTQKTGELIAAKTVRNYQGLLSTILGAAASRGHATRNWAKGIAITEGEPREPVFLSHREFGTILRFIPEYYRPLTLFLAMTGARWSEATAIEWQDISYDASPVTLRINKAWKMGNDGVMRLGRPKTKKSRRTITLDPLTVEALGTPGPPDQRVFIGIKGADRIWYGRFRESIFQKAVVAARDPERCAGLDLQPITKSPKLHDLRHTQASWLIAQNVPLPVIQNRLGHEPITTTIDTYGHLAPESMNATALVIEGIFSRVMDASGINAMLVIEAIEE